MSKEKEVLDYIEGESSLVVNALFSQAEWDRATSGLKITNIIVRTADLPLEQIFELAGKCEQFGYEVWETVDRAFVNQLLKIPNLEKILFLNLDGREKLHSFEKASALKEVRCDGLCEHDFRMVAHAPALELLTCHHSQIDYDDFKTLMKCPLKDLDLESCTFDDQMAQLLAGNRTLKTLYVCSTDLSGDGLKYICQMKQLEHLDLWVTNVRLEDLDILTELPRLKYLSIGGFAKGWMGRDVITKLRQLPSLENIWIDGGIYLSEIELAELKVDYKLTYNWDDDDKIPD